MEPVEIQKWLSLNRMLFVLARLDIMTSKEGREWIRHLYDKYPEFRESQLVMMERQMGLKKKYEPVLRVAPNDEPA